MFKNKNIANSFILGLMLLILVAPLFVMAEEGEGVEGEEGEGQPSSSLKIKINNPFNCGSTNCTLVDLLNAIIDKILIPVGAVIAVLMIMYAGFLFVTANGNEKQIEDAKQALLYACIGAAILLGAKILATAIKATIDQLK